jgi:putative phage-type endonuclease
MINKYKKDKYLKKIITEYLTIIYPSININITNYINLTKFDITNILKNIFIDYFNNNDKRDEIYRNICNNIIIPDEYLYMWKQYVYLENIPQPEQKSEEWFRMRNNFITASAGAQAIGESKYETPIELIKEKIGLGKGFMENANVYHGKKYEKIAILIYEHINNVKIGEFGLIPHIGTPKIDFLGASPDGICTCSTLDGTFSNLVGRMLEIKCTTSRKILTEGLEDGEICPHYYWVQVQLQLECCNLQECDFWQCKIMEYEYDKWINIIKENKSVNTIEQNIEIKIDDTFKFGTIIELLPINKEIPHNHKIEWYGKYIYPLKLCSINETVQWSNNMKINWKNLYPEYKNEYKFSKIIYWYLEKSHCYLIKRDNNWFKSNLHKFQEFWDQVEHYRNNKSAKQKLIDDIELEKKENKRKENQRYIDIFNTE